jgi:hydroxymethylglutaryl-CoA lyase
MMPVKLVECPRDAMQGFHHQISTEDKIEYINALLKVGFDALDCGSFVSAKAVPQLADTDIVLNRIDRDTHGTKLLVIVANERGAEEASAFENVDVIGFPFSISEQFQLRNTNQRLTEALNRLKTIKSISEDANKQLLIYLSMGFGNPYKDEWSTSIAIDWCKKLADMGIRQINLSDTIGVAVPSDIQTIFKACLQEMPSVDFGAHFHTRPDNYLANITAAYDSGCRSFDAAIKGFGGCPFATDKLTGNLPTEALLTFLNDKGEQTSINQERFDAAYALASRIFV